MTVDQDLLTKFIARQLDDAHTAAQTTMAENVDLLNDIGKSIISDGYDLTWVDPAFEVVENCFELAQELAASWMSTMINLDFSTSP